MKKVNRNGSPAILAAFVAANPNETWNHFRGNCRDGYEEVRSHLSRNQRGICAYCEIDLLRGNGVGLDDCMVEHFIPKTPHTLAPNNHALNWHNLLGTCLGGRSPGVCDVTRHTTPDHSCDVPKGDKNLNGVILDPAVDIPAFPSLFKFVEQGDIEVDHGQCPPGLIAKAEASIEHLNLNAKRLIRFRGAVISTLRKQFEMLVLREEMSEEDAMAELARIHLSPSENDNWPKFFTCIRWFFGPAAEAYLVQINYAG